MGVRFGGLTEKTPFQYRYFEVLGQKISQDGGFDFFFSQIANYIMATL